MHKQTPDARKNELPPLPTRTRKDGFQPAQLVEERIEKLPPILTFLAKLINVSTPVRKFFEIDKQIQLCQEKQQHFHSCESPPSLMRRPSGGRRIEIRQAEVPEPSIDAELISVPEAESTKGRVRSRSITETAWLPSSLMADFEEVKVAYHEHECQCMKRCAEGKGCGQRAEIASTSGQTVIAYYARHKITGEEVFIKHCTVHASPQISREIEQSSRLPGS